MKSPTAQKLSPLSAPKPLPAEPIPENGHSRSPQQGQDAFAIYIHWPYCESKCPYCDFNSYARRSISEEQFVAATLRELEFYSASTAGRPVSSIFFGGGTPSLMSAASVGTLLNHIAALWSVEPACEITLEANPSSVEAERFAGYRAAGVNRVSLGVQSFSDEQLRFLGRLHTAQEARAAIGVAARHFSRMSFDLIYARPGQRLEEWQRELGDALELARGHLSLYQLTIEPLTAFFDLERRGKLRIPEAELAADLYDLTQDMCEQAGMPAYEVSNHAAPGEESLHNLTYWRYGDYLGVGPGAHGRITSGDVKTATAAIRAPEAWHAQVLQLGHGLNERAGLSRCEEAEEMLLMGLRLREGFSMRKLATTGYEVADSEIHALAADELIERRGDVICVTKSGQLVLNAIVRTLANSLAEATPPASSPKTSILSDRGAEG